MHPETDARRPRLTPAMADVRRAVRELLAEVLPSPTASTVPAVQADPLIPDARRLGFAQTTPVPDARLVLVALSGGPDSLALAAALAFEAPRAGLAAGAIIVDHDLQAGSAEVAARAAEQARELGLDPVLVERVRVARRGGGAEHGVEEDGALHGGILAESADPAGAREMAAGVDAGDPAGVRGAAGRVEANGAAGADGRAGADNAATTNGAAGGVGAADGDGAAAADRGRWAGGPEAAARAARYGAFERALAATGASVILLAHTLDDQAETVLLGLARGSGPSSLSGMSAVNGVYLRPLLGIPRRTVHQSLDDQGLVAWHDPQNDDPAYARVRVRTSLLPMLEAELGPGVAAALARTAELLREDDEALDALAAEWATEIVEHAEAGIAIDVHGLVSNPPALAQRIVRFVVQHEFGTTLSRAQTLAALKLVTEWRGQAGVDLPGIHVARVASQLVFARRI